MLCSLLQAGRQIVDMLGTQKDKQDQPVLDVDSKYVSQATTRAFVRLCDKWKINDEMAASLALLDSKTLNLVKLGRWVGTLTKDQIVRIGLLFQLYESLHIVFDEELANSWVTMANKGSLCKGSTPLDVMSKEGLPSMVAFRNYMNKLAR